MFWALRYIGRCRTTPSVTARVPNQKATGCGNDTPLKDERFFCRFIDISMATEAGAGGRDACFIDVRMRSSHGKLIELMQSDAVAGSGARNVDEIDGARSRRG